MSDWDSYPPYVSVAEKKQKAEGEKGLQRLERKRNARLRARREV